MKVTAERHQLQTLRFPPPLLLTSAVHVSAPYVQLREAQARQDRVFSSLALWLKHVPTLQVVICDGSGHDFSSQVKEHFPSSAVESLAFHNDTAQVASRGKGYGEGQIVAHALAKSSILSSAEVFMKCTGGLWVMNLERCVREPVTDILCEPRFTSNSLYHIDSIDTRFYIVRRDFYLRNLLHSHQSVNDKLGVYLEHCFFSSLPTMKWGRSMFPERPLIQGISGTTGLASHASSNARQPTKHLRPIVRMARAKLLGLKDMLIR